MSTLQELYEHIVPAFPTSVQKDLKTAIRVLALALKYPTPKACPLDACLLPLPELYRSVDAYLSAQGKGPYTTRNVKNNLSRLFRLAESKGIYAQPPATPTPTFNPRHKPARPGSACNRPDGTYLPFAYWPSQLKADFMAFSTWATDPFVEGRDARWKKRPQTVHSYQTHCEAYFGFLHHIRHLSPLTFEQLFDFALIRAFVHWHVNEKHKRPTFMAHDFLKSLLALTRQYRPQPELREQIKAFRRTLPTPQPTFHKSDAWVPLAELARIGAAVWPRKLPSQLRTSGRGKAHQASLSLMLRLWVYIPYRQRNMREMRLYENLYKDPHGQWRIRFAGEQLKIATKQGRPNVFDLPFPTALVPTLEAYLHTWHPILVAGTTQPTPLLFPSISGTPSTVHELNEITHRIVYRYTGKHWHPHIIRSVWATERIRKTHGDFYTAAIMLNDKLETVIKTYAHLLEEDVAEKAYQWVQEQLTPPLGANGPHPETHLRPVSFSGR